MNDGKLNYLATFEVHLAVEALHRRPLSEITEGELCTIILWHVV